MRRSLLILFLVFLFATGFVAISALVSGDFTEKTLRIVITTGAASFYSLVALAAFSLLGRQYDIVGRIGLGFAGMAFVHALYTTWIDHGSLNTQTLTLLQNRLALFLVGVAFIHASLMLLIRPNGALVRVLVTVAIAAALAACLATVASVYLATAKMWLGIVVLGIISTCCTIGAPIANIALKK